jgi:hypothetical protein
VLIKKLCYLLLFLYTLSIHPEGFLPNTFVKTTSGYSYIERLNRRDIIFSHVINTNQLNQSVITHNNISTSDHYTKLTIEDSTICCAPDQKFYVYNHQQWITADQLQITDFLMNNDGEAIAIESIDHIKKDCIFYALSLKTNHTYYISHHNILVHNAVPVIVISIPAIVSTITPIVETLLATAGTFLGVHFIAKKFKHKQHASSMNSSSSNNYGSYYPDPNDPENDKNKRNDKEHPHGIYKDADYHHKNSINGKSPSPENGQRCLDYSIPVGKQRIAIEGNEFVVLRLTRPGEWHGFKVSWKDLEQPHKTVLMKNGFVKKSGKIIRQITEKLLS